MKLRAVAVIACASLLAGCGHKATTAPVLDEHLPPHVMELHPAARSFHVPYDTEIWARFETPLDTSSVQATTVFFKLDTQRLPVSFTFEDSARTLKIRPLLPLRLRRTYTIELTPRMRTVTGQAFDTTFFWQFSVISVRRIENPEPRVGQEFESPVAPLFFTQTDAEAGPIDYRIFVGADSAQVAAQTQPSAVSGSAFYLPDTRWEQGARIYWRAQAHNVETGEEEAGPVWSFRVTPAGATIDSTLIRPRDFGSYDTRTRSWACGTLQSSAVGSYTVTGLTRFDFAAVDSNMVVADAFVTIAGTDPTTPLFRYAELWQTDRAWIPCNLGNPPASYLFAPGVWDGTSHVRFASVALAAQVQGKIRRHAQLFEYAFRSRAVMNYFPLESESGIRVYYYRPAASGGTARNR